MELTPITTDMSVEDSQTTLPKQEEYGDNRDTSLEDNSDNSISTETESEKRQTETLTKQLSDARIGDEDGLFQKGPIRMPSADGVEIPLFSNNHSFYQGYNGIVMDNMPFTDQSLVRQQSNLLLEMKKNFSFSRMRSSSVGNPSMILPFSRNSSMEGSLYPNDLYMQRSPSTMITGDFNFLFSPNQDSVSKDANHSVPAEMNRNDSLRLEGLQLMDLKRHSFYSGETDNKNKFIRQNTQTLYTAFSPTTNNQPTPINPASTPYPNENEGRRLLTAEINGVMYQSELKKKDKRDPQKWSKEEDDLLREAVNEFGEKQWKDIAQRIPGRSHVQCLQRWKKVLKPGLKKGHWTEEEDSLLRTWKDRCSNWAEVAEKIPGRTAKQCRERWCNHVDPSIRKGNWTEEEDRLIISLQKEWGNRWSSIANNLVGRSENAVKIRWKTLCRHGLNLNDKASKPVIPVHQSSVVPSTVMTQPMTQPIAQPIAQPMTQPIAQPVPQPIAQPVPQPVPFIASPSYVSVASIPLYTPQQSFTYGMVQDNSVYGSLVTGMNEGTLYSQPDTNQVLQYIPTNTQGKEGGGLQELPSLG